MERPATTVCIDDIDNGISPLLIRGVCLGQKVMINHQVFSLHLDGFLYHLYS